MIIVDVEASMPNSNALYVVAYVARYNNTNDDMDILKQESLLEVGVDVDEALLETMKKQMAPWKSHLGILLAWTFFKVNDNQGFDLKQS
jgi:hypothetical protein